MVKLLKLLFCPFLVWAMTANAYAVTDSIGLNISSNATVRYVTVKSFTAQGIQDALDLLPSTGGEIYLPPGTYSMTTTANTNTTAKIVCSTSNVVIRGAGTATVIDSTGAGGGHVFDLQGSKIDVRDIYFYGSASTGGAYADGGKAIRILNASGTQANIAVQNCLFVNHVNALDEGDSTFSGLRFENNYISYCAGVITPDYAVIYQGRGGVFTGNVFDGVYRGILLEAGGASNHSNLISGNTFRNILNAGGIGVVVNLIYGAAINGNVFDLTSTGSNGVYFVSTQYSSIVGNVFASNTGAPAGTPFTDTGSNNKKAHNIGDATHDL